MNNNDAVFEHIVNQLRDASAHIKELHKDLARIAGEVEAYKLICDGRRKEDTQVMEPWIKWRGGECPVPPGVPVEVIYRDNDTQILRSPEAFRWAHYNAPSDIILYRVVKPACDHDWYRSCLGSFEEVCVKCGAKR
ncbi:hypothetical protein ACTBWA_004334 [Salmonella enterica subsp. enterica serovar Newport]